MINLCKFHGLMKTHEHQQTNTMLIPKRLPPPTYSSIAYSLNGHKPYLWIPEA
jgi:hypothetical protein